MHPEDQARNRNGQFVPGVSGNPGGRPAAESLTSLLRKELAKEHHEFDPDDVGELRPSGRTRREEMAKIMVDKAVGGDLRFCQEVIKRDDQNRLQVQLPPMPDAAGCVEASGAVFEALGQGRISVAEAREISDMIEQRRRAIETLDLDRRVIALEEQRREEALRR